MTTSCDKVTLPNTAAGKNDKNGKSKGEKRQQGAALGLGIEALDEEEMEQRQMELEGDYEMGIAFQERLVPHAIKWFTGEADDEDEYDEDEDDMEDFEDDEV